MGCGSSVSSVVEASESEQWGESRPQDNLALSVEYLESTFVAEVEGAGLNVNSDIRAIEKPVIRAKGREVWCRRHDMMGSAYVDAVNTEGSVDLATQMLSYTW